MSVILAKDPTFLVVLGRALAEIGEYSAADTVCFQVHLERFPCKDVAGAAEAVLVMCRTAEEASKAPQIIV